MTHPLHKAAALVAASAITLTALAGAPAQAAPAAKTDPAALDAAASWLKGELTDGLVVGAIGTDYGLTIDVALALNENSEKASVRAISNAVAAKVNDYISGGAVDPDSTYAGPTAKAAVLARIAGANPTSYGGVNLISRLEERVATTAPIAGRIQDKSKFGDFANVVGQAYAARALTEAKSQRAEEAVDFLLAQQCASGFFRLNFTADKTSTAQGCAEGTKGSEPDTDATALAVINLVESGDHSKEVQDALAKAGTWLAAQQKSSGAFGGGPSTEAPNTNSTGLAGWALGVLKNKAAAAKAAVWVRKHQPIDVSRCRSALTKDRGAIAYDKVAVKTARTAGITAAVADQWRRSTAQAAPVLQWAPASPDALTVTPKRLRGEAGTKMRFKVTGIAPGERACLSIKGDYKRLVGKATGGVLARKLELPRGDRTRTVKVKTIDDSAKTRVQVHN